MSTPSRRRLPPLLAGLQANRNLLPLLLLIAIATAQLVAYANVVPLWQVPDEPRHFAYVRTLLLRSQDLDAQPEVVEREILNSMREHGVWSAHRLAPPPDTVVVFDDVPYMRQSASPEGRQPALYYWLNAWLLRLSGEQTLEGQLLLARLLSGLLGIATVAVAYATARVVMPGQPGFALLTGLIVALIPQRAFMASGVNNDNIAILAGSLCFLAVALLLARGVSGQRMSFLFATMLGLFLTKTTALPMLLAPFALVLAHLFRRLTRDRSPRQLLLLTAFSLAFCVFLVPLTIDFEGNATHWQKAGNMPGSRLVAENPAGSHALRVVDDDQTTYETLSQQLSPEAVRQLAGQQITFGGWVRTVQEQQFGHLQVFDGYVWHSITFQPTSDWQYVAKTITLSHYLDSLKVNLNATKGSVTEFGEVHYAGVYVVAGALADHGSPQYSDGARTLFWDDYQCHNLVSNGAATESAPAIRGAAFALAEAIGAADLLSKADFLIDLNHYQAEYKDIYRYYVKRASDSFWAYFGWMSTRLAEWHYQAIEVATALTLLSALCGLTVDRRPATATLRRLVLLSLALVVVSFAATLLRQIPPHGMPQGRYSLPAVGPFAVVAAYGLWGLLPPRFAPLSVLVTATGLLALNLASIRTIAAYFAGG